MKWYPLAHLAAVTMSCFCTELQALQLFCPRSASGIARALHSFLLYNFEFPDSRCRSQVLLSDNLSFSSMSGSKHELCSYEAGMAKSRWAETPSYAKTTDLSGSMFSSPVPGRHRKTDSIHYSSSCRGKHLIGDIAMVIVKSRPRWPRTWRYTLHSLSSPTMTPGRLG